ncbi:lipoyl(octanoyl) transferase [Thiogranum longum]|uniref:Octanoyltransferase n=1 Tax=Thiogranum longum TaxID=1537524 RepID=A0A4R1H9N0_9GAMM|nr:lipoyl(octanoyl) transferase LipB [Thiogranum longum]TCK17221.1 lipoyl(octanoyl) transferase [Thiogranum longum]
MTSVYATGTADSHSASEVGSPAVRRLGLSDYEPVWRQMQAHTEHRSGPGDDAIWLLEHRPVFTQGMNGKPEHLLAPGDIPVVEVDRGGQVTYHGPGQLVAYLMLDLRARNLGIRGLVELLEQSVIDWLGSQGISAHARRDAPGVYVDGAKIAALGLRVRRGCSYHGLSFNVDMDLEPFSRINPCGYAGMDVTQLRDLGVAGSVETVAQDWLPALLARLEQQKPG